jgi:hypothetical protein
MFARRRRTYSLHRRNIRLETLLVLAAGLSVPGGPSAGEPVGSSGFVFETTGDWTSERTGEPPRRFQPVFPGDEIRPPLRPTSGSSVRIAFYDGTAVRLTCRSPKVCDAAYHIRTPPAEDAFFSRLGKALSLLMPSEVDLPAVPAVRGLGPREAVLARTGASLDVAPVLAEVSPGRYTLDLRPWTKTGAGVRGTAIEVAWRRPHATVLSGAPPAPGL